MPDQIWFDNYYKYKGKQFPSLKTTQHLFTFIHKIKCCDACLEWCLLFYQTALLCHDTMFFYATPRLTLVSALCVFVCVVWVCVDMYDSCCGDIKLFTHSHYGDKMQVPIHDKSWNFRVKTWFKVRLGVRIRQVVVMVRIRLSLPEMNVSQCNVL